MHPQKVRQCCSLNAEAVLLAELMSCFAGLNALFKQLLCMFCAPAKMPSTLARARMVSSASLCPICITRSTLCSCITHRRVQPTSDAVQIGIVRHLDLTCCSRPPSCQQGDLSHLSSILLHHSIYAVDAVESLERS